MPLVNYLIKYTWGSLLWLGMLFLWPGSSESFAQQETPKKQADAYFNAQDYFQAIQSYTELLDDNSLPTDTKKEILYNLGYAYKEVSNYVKAEEIFRQMMELGAPEGPTQLAYLYYAQALGHNGKIKEAQEVFEQYEAAKLTPSNPTTPGLNSGAVLFMAGVDSVKVTYRVENLGINTAQAEFSPAFFRDGLVYIAGKGSSQSSSSPDKGYLDLFYVPRLEDLAAVGIVGTDNKVTDLAPSPSSPGTKAGRLLGRDTYTRPTANDSRTTGSYTPFSFSEGLVVAKSPKKRSKGEDPQEFSKDLNTKYHEGPATFSADGSTIIFTRNNYNSGKSSKSSDNINKLKLYSAELRDGGWSNVVELPFNSDEYSTGHPTLTRDGKTLYFVSDRPGGRGGTDLYVSQLVDGAWSSPSNVGAEINTKGDEMFPFVDENGNLYFSSNGHAKRLGELDIYFALLARNTAPQIMHLDAPINSKGDDFGLITDGNRTSGYLSSNRLRGDDDIFRFVRESSLSGCRNLAITVTDEGKSGRLDSVAVLVRARGEGRREQTLYTDSKGMINICLEENNDFLFELSKDGYVSSTLGFSTIGLTDDKPSLIGAILMQPSALAPTRLSGPSRVSSGGSDEAADEWETSTPITASLLRGTVTGEADKTPIEGVRIILKNECDSTIKQTVTGPDGRYQFQLIEGCDYTLVASKSLYGTNTNAITKIPPLSKPKLVSANLKMLKAGDLMTLDNIQYDSGKWDIRPDAAQELDKMVATMRKYPSLKIEIGSHTDSQGSAQFNQYLSDRRAKAALNYLASKGISRSRMTAKGYGESQLVNQCKDGVLCTEEEHQRNRRTEFKVLFIR